MAKAVRKSNSEETVPIKAPRKAPGEKIPVVSIVGRQNVGKSTLFNSLLKKKLAITEDYPGVTRDVLSARVYQEEKDLNFYLCDTPGLDIENPDSLSQSILEAAYRQLNESDVIIFLLDKNLVTVADHTLLDYLRKNTDPWTNRSSIASIRRTKSSTNSILKNSTEWVFPKYCRFRRQEEKSGAIT